MATVQRLTVALDIAFIAFITFLVGRLIDAWSPFGLPLGTDAYNQLQKVKWILDFWPHVTWSYQWTGGMPLMRWYPPALYYLIASIVVLTKSSIEIVTVSILYSLYFLGGLGTYAFTWRLSGSRLTGLLGALLVLISPSVWDQFVIGGAYGRVGALMLLPFALWATLASIHHESDDRQARIIRSLLVLILALSILFNPLIGVPVVAIVLLAVLFLEEGASRKVRNIFGIVTSVLFLDAFFLIPFLLKAPRNLGAETWGTGNTMNFFALSRFPAWEPSTYLKLSPIMVAFSIVVVVIALFVRIETSSSFERRVLRFLSLTSALILLSMVAGLIISVIVGYIALMVTILPFILVPLLGMIYHRILGMAQKAFPYITTFLMIGLIASMFVISGVPVTKFAAETVVPDDSIRVLDQLRIDQSQVFYRIGVPGTEGWVGEWWSYRSKVPQTRNYYGQGVLYPDWYAWFNDAVWTWKGNYEEVNFLLDWWAVRWILVNRNANDPGKFLSRPNLYQSVSNVTIAPFYEFEYSRAQPILHATNTPTIFVIGNQYRNVINDLAYSSFSDSKVIPVHGGQYVDDYSIDDLRHFDAVMIYGYDYHDRTRAWDLLRQYVVSGGGLIIETGLSPDATSAQIPLPSPVDKTIGTNFGTKWQFSWIQNDVTNGIDFTSFAPAISSGVGWGVSASYNSSVRDWARPIVWDAGQPLLAVGQLGKGRVLWSGINLPYHLTTYKNYEEAKLLASAVAWACGNTQPKASEFVARQDTPEEYTVVMNSAAQGVLLKQFYYADWKARIDAGSAHKSLPIFQVGPDFMYVSIPKDITYPAILTFQFDKTVDYVGLLVSSAGLLALAAYTALGTHALSGFLAGLNRRRREWWLKE